MTNLYDLRALKQKDIERLFMSHVFVYPIEAVRDAGWLDPSSIQDASIRKFWDEVTKRVDPAGDNESASGTVMQIALELDVYSDMIARMDDITGAYPLALANEILRRSDLTNKAILLPQLAEAITTGDDVRAADVLGRMSTRQPGVLSLPTAAEIAERFERLVLEGNRGFKTYITPLDRATGGLEKQTLTVLAGRPGSGKTAIGFQIARNVAQSGRLVHFFSLEMSSTSLWSRAACPRAGVQWHNVLSDDFKADDLDRIIEASKELAAEMGNNLRVVDNRQTTETIWQAVARERPALVVIDHLRFIQDEGENENKRLGKITEKLHNMAKAYDIPVLLLVQLNRQVELQKSKVPELKDLRDSGEIEENADNVWMLYHKDDHTSQSSSIAEVISHKVQLWVRKYRNGPADVAAEMLFNMRDYWFSAIGETDTWTR